MALTKVTGEGVGSLDAITIGDGTAADKKILFDGNAQDFHIGLDDSSDSLTIGLGSTLGTTSHMVIDANGHVTKPLQSAFHAKAPGTQTNLSVETGHDVTFNSERFDQNADYDGTNQFTAPVTGKYQLNVNLYLQHIDSGANYIQVGVLTSNKSYYLVLATNGFDADPTYFPFTTSVLADMDANDTVKIEIYQSGGTAKLDIDGHSTFSGYLVA
jgi:hypothetical protein